MRNPSDISGLYQSLVQHKIHQDQLLWNRVQTVYALQAALLSSGFALHSWDQSVVGGSLLVFAGLATLCLLFLIIGDYADMKVNEPIMNKLAKRLLCTSGILDKIEWTDRTVWHRKLVRGHHLIYSIMVVFIVLDFVLGVCLLSRPSIFR